LQVGEQSGTDIPVAAHHAFANLALEAVGELAGASDQAVDVTLRLPLLRSRYRIDKDAPKAPPAPLHCRPVRGDGMEIDWACEISHFRLL
jgi:hypothetical protein